MDVYYLQYEYKEQYENTCANLGKEIARKLSSVCGKVSNLDLERSNMLSSSVRIICMRTTMCVAVTALIIISCTVSTTLVYSFALTTPQVPKVKPFTLDLILILGEEGNLNNIFVVR